MLRPAPADGPDRNDPVIDLAGLVSLQALAFAGLTWLLLITGAALPAALLGAWLMAGVVTLGLLDTVIAPRP